MQKIEATVVAVGMAIVALATYQLAELHLATKPVIKIVSESYPIITLLPEEPEIIIPQVVVTKTAIVETVVPVVRVQDKIDKVIPALAMVESRNNPSAIGDHGRAKGCLQVHKAVLADVARQYGEYYTHDQMFVPELAKRVCKLYLVMHCGKNASYEQYARTWNSGPSGCRRNCSTRYWHKVRAELS